jgi:hypothetical protein
MPSTKWHAEVVASKLLTNETRINFYDEYGNMVASYPNRYTCIEKIK